MLDFSREPELDDELAAAFPGSTITHVLTVIARDPLDLAIGTLEVVRAQGGGLAALHLVRRGDRFEHRLSLTGLAPAAARRLADRLAARPGVERATIEHQILFR